MLYLLFSVSLDPFEKSLKALLLFDAQFLHFFHEYDLQVLLSDCSLVHDLLFNKLSHSLCLVIVLNSEKDLLLFAHLD